MEEFEITFLEVDVPELEDKLLKYGFDCDEYSSITFEGMIKK